MRFRSAVSILMPFVGLVSAAEPPQHLREALAFDAATASLNCPVTEWAPTGECDATTFLQPFMRQTGDDGEGCGYATETRKCKAVDCQLSPWTPWSEDCNASGFKTRSRVVAVAPLYGGRACRSLADQVKCRAADCRVCDWSDWVCNDKTGKQSRSRRVAKKAARGGKPCPRDLAETKPCDPVDCVLATTGAWSACEEPGRSYFERDVVTPAQFNGKCERVALESWCTAGVALSSDDLRARYYTAEAAYNKALAPYRQMYNVLVQKYGDRTRSFALSKLSDSERAAYAALEETLSVMLSAFNQAK